MTAQPQVPNPGSLRSCPPDTLVLRFADVGIATYASLRVVGRPDRTVTWVVDEPFLLAALDELAGALPEPNEGETVAAALTRALTVGPFADQAGELTLAYRLGVLLVSDAGWQLLLEYANTPRSVLFVSPSARLARVPWGMLALPVVRPTADDLLRAKTAAVTVEGTSAARITWPAADAESVTEGYRLMELVDVLMAVPANIVNSPRPRTEWGRSADRPPLLVLDPRVPGQRADSALGSVLGRPSPDAPLARHFAATLSRGPVLPAVAAAVELFRRTDADWNWLADRLADGPSRLMFVGHASAADSGSADRAALHLADERPLTAADVMSMRLVMPPRVALLACASGGDYRFDEATGLVAAAVLGGAQLVTATLWSLPTTAGYRQFTQARDVDPMADVIVAVDEAHQSADAGRDVNRWQRDQMRRWRAGDATANPVYWAALVTFTVDGAR
nr:CHAT domain-containing protein [Mycobacterium sp. URHB0044]